MYCLCTKIRENRGREGFGLTARSDKIRGYLSLHALYTPLYIGSVMRKVCVFGEMKTKTRGNIGRHRKNSRNNRMKLITTCAIFTNEATPLSWPDEKWIRFADVGKKNKSFFGRLFCLFFVLFTKSPDITVEINESLHLTVNVPYSRVHKKENE